MTLALLKHAALRRFGGKLIDDLIPAALASGIAGLVLAHVQMSPAAPPRTQANPAGAEMVQMVRDEHALILDYLKAEAAARTANEQARADEMEHMKAVATAERTEKIAALAEASKPNATPAKLVRKVALNETVPLPPPSPVEPLNLQAMNLPAEMPAERPGFVRRQVRAVVATAERIPNWLGDAANWVVELPGKALPERVRLRASL